ncbi:MAG: carbohydrate-binding protein [Oligoflexus sp.]|nr:carbohydrate-binding protein [Oligoflexus sp.]
MKWTSVLFFAVATLATFKNGEAEAETIKVDGADAYVVPGRVEAEAFHRFKDTDLAHAGNCGTGPVDAEVTSDPTGGNCNVGWTAPGEWLEYDIFSQTKGVFGMKVRVAGQMPDTRLHVELDGFNISNSLLMPQAGWQVWDDRVIDDVYMACGKHRLRVYIESGSVNINYMDFWLKRAL